MSKQSARRKKARMIRAASSGESIQFDASCIEWIQAAADDADKPKKFSMTAYTGGAMSVGYYGSPVVIDLAGLSAKAPIPILLGHDTGKIVGHADQVDVASSLKLSGVISGASAEADQVTASAKMGFPWKASVGADPGKMDFVAEGATVQVNGRTFKGPVYVARKATLGEVSFVPIAADSKTSTKVAASAASDEKERNMGFEAWVEAQGFVLADLTDQQKAYLEAQYAVSLKAAADAPPVEGNGKAASAPALPVFDVAAVVLAHTKHQTAVEARAAAYHGKIPKDKLDEIVAKASSTALALKAKALNEEWTAEHLAVELVKAEADATVELVRAERPTAPAIHGSNRDAQPQAIEAALARSAGIQNAENHYSAEVLEASDKAFRGIGLQETLLLHAQANGYHGRASITTGNLREVIEAAFSTHTLTTLLTNTGNKLLLDGFNSVPQSWRSVASVASVQDFKTMTAFRLTSDLEYEEVGPAGEIGHGTLGQESYTYQAKTYARMLALTRQDIINDDLSALAAIRSRLGLGAAIKMNKLFWTVWLTARNGAAFWTADRGNLVTSAALASAGLTAAVKAFRDLAAPDGNMMNLEPEFILVPTDLEYTARNIYVSQEIRDTTASTKTFTTNVYQNKFKPIVVPELGSSSFTGYSATSWHMLCSPAILASASMCFLNGQQSPTIESADADFNTLGIQFRGYHDFGAQMTEYRASVEAQA